MHSTDVNTGKLHGTMRSRKGKDCWGPGCVLEACFYCCTLFLYYLGFGLIRFILPIAPCSLGGASLRVSEKIIHWEISKMPPGKSFKIIPKCFVLIYIGKVPIIKLISLNSTLMPWDQIFTKK